MTLLALFIILSFIYSWFAKPQSNALYCGICGFSGKGEAYPFMILLLANQIRGDHATGIYTNKAGIYKKAKKATEFIQEIPWEEGSTVGLGHTRYGTMGANVDTNAHPFKKGNIIGVHNGVLWGHTTLAKELGVEKTYQVDSELIFESIKQKGWKSISNVEGNVAIAYTDKGNNLYLYRRDNPIFIGFIGEVLYFSSLKDSLERIDCHDISSLELNKLFIYNNGKLKKTLDVPHVSKWAGARSNWDDEISFYKRPTTIGKVWDHGSRSWVYPKSQVNSGVKTWTAWDEENDSDDPIYPGTCTLPAKIEKEVEVEEDIMTSDDLLFSVQCLLEDIIQNDKINFSSADKADINIILDKIESYFILLDKE